MKELLLQYASYHIWANKKMFERVAKLSNEQINQEIASSFPSIYKTVLHMLDAESIWWQRLHLAEKIEVPSKTFTGSFAELLKASETQSKLWEDWVKNATTNQLEYVLGYYTMDSTFHKNPVHQLLLHLFNHGTYHRGQIVTMLRQLGVDKIPSTDFIAFTRPKTK